MGVFETMSDVGEWFKDRWDEDWGDFGTTFSESWSSLPGAATGVGKGIVSLASAPFTNEADFWGSARLLADSAVAIPAGLLGGTVGTVFQIPILHETGWLLDQAYRYGVARPITTPMIMAANNEMDAYLQGTNSNDSFFGYMTDFNNLKKAWNQSDKATPGQMSVYLGSTAFQQNFDDYDEAMKWMQQNDPRTPEGQLKYNSADADSWLKYGSGSQDFLLNIVIDPSHGASKLFKLGKLRLVDKVADSRYILAGKVEKEVGASNYDNLRNVAKEIYDRGGTWEEFRDLTMPQSPRGNQIAPIWFTAAQRGEDVWHDAYLTVRAFDPEAAERLAKRAPDIASDFADMFANFTIGDLDYQRGRLAAGAKGGADVLKLTKLDAFVDSKAGREGLWGKALGLGLGDRLPRAGRISKIRVGYHNWVLRSAPIIIGRPLANLLTSQGHTKFIDANDNTAFSTRQFKANLERSTTRENRILTDHEINDLTSRYGAATSDATRHAVAEQAENLVVAKTLKEFGLKEADLATVLHWANQNRSRAGRLISNSRLYISDLAAKRAQVAVESGDLEMGKRLEEVAAQVKEDAKNGGIDFVSAVTGQQGRVELVPLTYARMDQTLPILRSQFAETITMMDYRALRASLRWWKIVHPEPKRMPNPDVPGSYIKGNVPLWQLAFARAAKTRGWYQSGITALDAVSSMWKATALLRPAQAPRNVASDTVLTIAEFGKLPVLIAAAYGPVNAMRNIGARGALRFDLIREWLTHRYGNGTAIKTIEAEKGIHVPGNADVKDTKNPAASYSNAAFAYAYGDWNMDQYVDFLDEIFFNDVTLHETPKNVPAQTAFVPFASRAAIEQGRTRLTEDRAQGRGRAERIDPNRVPPSTGGPGFAEALRGPSWMPTIGPPEPSEAPTQAPGTPETPQARKQRMDEMSRRVSQLHKGDQGTPARIANDEDPEVGQREHDTWEVAQPRHAPHPEGWSTARIEMDEHQATNPNMPPTLEREPGGPVEMESFAEGPTARRRGKVIPAPYEPWRVGQPYFFERIKWGQRKRKEISEADYRKSLHSLAIAAAGRNLYTVQGWGAGVIQDLIDRHLSRRSDPGYKDDPYMPGTLVVDPFTGTQPSKLASDIRKNFDITSEGTLQTADVIDIAGKPRNYVARQSIRLQMVNWIDDNARRLLEPNTLMAMRVRPDGNIAIGVATAKREVVEAGETIKPGTRSQIKNFRFKGIRDSAHTGFEFKDKKTGQVLMKLDGWAEDETGMQLQARLSARDNPSTQYQNLINNVDVERMMNENGPQHNIQAGEEGYKQGWERAVNAQIASDAVAKRFLQRKADGTYRTADDIYDEVTSTAWGTKWLHAMSFRGTAIFQHIEEIGAMVDTYIPHPNDMPDELASAVHALRTSVRSKQATYTQFEDLYRGKEGVDLTQMPDVHGPSIEWQTGNGHMWNTWRDGIRSIQKVISDMPVDKMARFPFMSMAYRQHGTELAKVAAHHFPNGPIPADIVKLIKDAAREKGYHDTRYRLYDTAQRNDVAAATRLLMPFSSAMMDTYIKYGRIVRENPMLLVQGAYYWDLFEREEMVQDENGYVARIEEGSLRWYAVDPKTGAKTLVPENKVGKQRYVQFQFPTELAHLVGQKYYGVDAHPVMAINKDTMNVFLNLPSGGPLVALPANEFALANPEFGESEFTKKYLLPFGPSTDRTRAFIPGTVRGAWEAFVADDGNMAQGHAAAIMQAELIAYANGTRSTPPTFEEVREKAAGLRYLRFASTMLSPASFQVKSPYQPYIDSYRQLLADPKTAKTAPEEFLKRNGDEFFAVMMSVTRNNAGLSASLESAQSYNKYRDLIQEYPEFGGLIVGAEGAGAFAKSVYESQKETPLGPGDSRTMRELLSLKDSTEDLQKKTAWMKYMQMMQLVDAAMRDRGLQTINGRGAEDLAASRDAFVEMNKYWTNPASGKYEISPWYVDYQTSSRGLVEKRQEALQVIARDPKLQSRDDIQGLAQYLYMRDRMQQEMRYWGFKSLDSKGAVGLRTKWEQQVSGLVGANSAFSDLYLRWLSTDDKLDLPKLEQRAVYGEFTSGQNRLGVPVA